MNDAQLLKRLNSHPDIKARVESLLALIEGTGKEIKKADEAERRVIEELRKTGNEILTDWANGRVHKSAAQFREEMPEALGSGQKKLIGTPCSETSA